MQCADVTLVNTPLSESDYSTNCKNNTGIKVSNQNIAGNPNGTATESTPSSSASAAASSTPTGAATQAKAISWVLGAVGFAGLALL
jgi:hypothetical protein